MQAQMGSVWRAYRPQAMQELEAETVVKSYPLSRIPVLQATSRSEQNNSDTEQRLSRIVRGSCQCI